MKNKVRKATKEKEEESKPVPLSEWYPDPPSVEEKEKNKREPYRKSSKRSWKNKKQEAKHLNNSYVTIIL